MKVTVNKCEQCGEIFEDEAAYQKHMVVHTTLTLLEGAFPSVKEDHFDFASGYFCVQRSAKWLKGYKQIIEELVGPSKYELWSHIWLRSLRDGGSLYYRVACRALNICPVCYREWGQACYAEYCGHTEPPRKEKHDQAPPQ
jgi:hypothetical protein